eukprot:SAG11_NODE_106_length_16423_cov_51.220840_13_plen_132_part_00
MIGGGSSSEGSDESDSDDSDGKRSRPKRSRHETQDGADNGAAGCALDSEDGTGGSSEEDEEGGEESEDEGGGPQTKRAAAAVSVGVGSFADPAGAQGLAHFVEHMLFMGSTKYPDENETEAYLAAVGEQQA